MTRIPPRFGRPPDMQTDKPSQQPPSNVPPSRPFTPVRQPDIGTPFRTQLGPLDQASISGDPATGGMLAPDEMSDVRHVFDSRPPMAFDWYLQDLFQGVTPGTVPTSELGGFTVPDGYILIVRHVSLSFLVAGDLFGITLGNAFGGLNSAVALSELPQLSLMVDNVPTQFFTPTPPAPAGPALRGIPLFDALMGDVNIPCFVPVSGGSNFNIRPFINYPSVNGTTYDVYARYYGNLLLGTGRSLVNEVGNQFPLPVTIQEMG